MSAFAQTGQASLDRFSGHDVVLALVHLRLHRACAIVKARGRRLVARRGLGQGFARRLAREWLGLAAVPLEDAEQTTAVAELARHQRRIGVGARLERLPAALGGRLLLAARL